MPLLFKPDSEEVFKRHEAFWHREIIDHPPLPGSFVFPKPGAKPFPEKTYATLEEKWLDIDYRAERMAYEIGQRDYLYDSIPIAFPNLGPEIFSAWYGCGYAFGETTTWTLPAVHDVEKDAVRLDMNHPLFQKLVDFTARLIELGRGKFVVGLTDFHPGGDHLAALRDPVNLNIDLIENPEWVDRMLSQSMAEYYAAYGVFYHMIHRAGMVTTSWLNIVHDGTYYIPSNEFSCMISTA
ncbi:MAG TPA: hypothetical protein PKE04_14895, partial [Clostridia bacterium]|nr:hypothetical protein [Clostridia bacterium]